MSTIVTLPTSVIAQSSPLVLTADEWPIAAARAVAFALDRLGGVTVVLGDAERVEGDRAREWEGSGLAPYLEMAGLDGRCDLRAQAAWIAAEVAYLEAQLAALPADELPPTLHEKGGSDRYHRLHVRLATAQGAQQALLRALGLQSEVAREGPPKDGAP